MDKNITLQDLQASVEELKQLCGQIVEDIQYKALQAELNAPRETKAKLESLRSKAQLGVIADAYGSTTLDTTQGGLQ